jgi:hypothetical protein
MLPASATSLIIGDSNLKNIKAKRLSREGGVQVRTFRGAAVADIAAVFDKMNAPSTVAKVVLHVGTNNVTAAVSNLDGVICEYSELLASVKDKLPKAEVAVSAVPPQKPWGRLNVIRKLNERLAHLCKANGTTFLSHNALWSTDSDGKVDPSVIVDKVHFSPRGLGLYLREVKAFVFGRQSRKDNHASSLMQSSAAIDLSPRHPPNSSKTSYASIVKNQKTKEIESKDGAKPDNQSSHSTNCTQSSETHAAREGSDGRGDNRPDPYRLMPVPMQYPFPFMMGHGQNPFHSQMPMFNHPMFQWYYGRPPPTGAAGWPTPVM